MKRNDKPKPQPTTNPRWNDKGGFGEYSSAAHHLICGNQALRGHVFERWICEAPYTEKGNPKKNVEGAEGIEHDTGWDINNEENGIWFPSMPKGFKAKQGFSWGEIADIKTRKDNALAIEGMLIKQKAAFWIMKHTNLQFHCGHHDFDPDIDDGEKDAEHLEEEEVNYIEYITEALNRYEGIMDKQKKKCPRCGKYRSDEYANTLLNQLSKDLQNKVTGSPLDWKLFVSKYAVDFHMKVKKEAAEKSQLEQQTTEEEEG